MKISLSGVLKPPWVWVSIAAPWRWIWKLPLGIRLVLAGTFGVLTLIAVFAAKGFFATPELSLLNNDQQTSIFFDTHGKPLRGYCTPPYCREIIPLEKMGDFPKYVVAAEDKHFWHRWTPYDRRAFYAFWKFITTLRKDHGGASTITQQLSKITSLTAEIVAEREKKTFGALLWRKGREMWIAANIETNLDRKQILEHYLNNVWCGERHGVQLCSRVLFGKEAEHVKSVAKIALFAGLLRKPSASPFRSPERARSVRSRVLAQFENEGLITSEQKKRFDQEPLPASRTYFCESGHFNEFIRQQIVENGRLVNQGLRVETTLDCDLQNVAKKTLRASMDAMIERNSELASDLRGLAFMIDRRGAIKVFAQEPGFSVSQHPLTNTWRQAGSAYKPIAYAAATAKINLRWSCKDGGSGPCILHDDRGLSIKMSRREWKTIRNFDNLRLADYAGKVSPLQALAESRNAATMSMIAGVHGGIGPRVGVEDIMKFASTLKLHFPVIDGSLAQEKGIRILGHEALAIGIPTNTIHPGLTIAIGSVEVTPYELARAFSAFAFGELVEPYGIASLKAPHGKNIEPKRAEPEKVFESIFREKLRKQFYKQFNNDLVRDLTQEEEEKVEAEAKLEAKKFWYTVLRGLRATMEFPTGTGHPMYKNLGFQMCGKTGTATNAAGESTDNWFVGCTPSHVMVVWIGRDKKYPMPNTYDENNVKIQETGGRNARIVAEKTLGTAYKKRLKEFFPEATDPLKPFVFLEKTKEHKPEPKKEPLKQEPELPQERPKKPEPQGPEILDESKKQEPV